MSGALSAKQSMFELKATANTGLTILKKDHYTDIQAINGWTRCNMVLFRKKLLVWFDMRTTHYLL